MFSSAISASGSVRGGNGGWLSGLTDTTSNPSPRKRPTREMTLPIFTKETGELSETGGVPVPQPIVTVASRLGVLGWFGSSSSVNSGTGSVGVGERPIGDESNPQIEEPAKVQAEEVMVDHSQPVCPVPDREGLLLERERQVDSREKELEERKVAMDQRERELEDRSRELVDRERLGKEVEEATQRRIEEVERRERELEERRGEFEKERERWVEEKNAIDENSSVVSSSAPEVIVPEPQSTPEWKNAMEDLKKEINIELSVERRKTEERELALETKMMKQVTDMFSLDKDEQNSKIPGWKKKWDISFKPLTRKGTSSTLSDFGI